MELYKYFRDVFSKQFATELSSCIHRFNSKLSVCELCRNENVIHPFICQTCLADLPLFTYENISENLLEWPAINTLFPKRNFDQLLCLSPYTWPVDHWLKQYKYQSRFELAHLIAFLLQQLFIKHGDTIKESELFSVPVHLKKWQQRGYNQAHLIANLFAAHTHLLYRDKAIIRTNFTPSQVGKGGNSRRKGLVNAFKLSDQLTSYPERIILFDDVITTGSTVNAICKLFKKKGVKHITVLTVALSLPTKF